MKLAVITSSRADWGLLQLLVDKIEEDKFFNFSIIYTGEHLTPKRIGTYYLYSGCHYMIECNLDSDSPVGVSTAMGLCQIKFAELYNQTKPDAVLCLGDRFEVLASILPAYIARIPILHVHGGEISGNLDNSFRYMISKMASLHFVSHEIHRIQLSGFNQIPQEDIHVVGALGCDGLKPDSQAQSRYGLLIIYHPNTLEDENWRDLFLVLDEQNDPCIFITPNADNGNQEIREAIINFCSNRNERFYAENLEREKFIKLLSVVKAIIGNSSSGIIEAPALATPTIDVGSRQKGRLRASSIIDCEMKADSIREAFKKLESPEFQQSLDNIKRPYKGENVAEKIINIIKERFR